MNITSVDVQRNINPLNKGKGKTKGIKVGEKVVPKADLLLKIPKGTEAVVKGYPSTEEYSVLLDSTDFDKPVIIPTKYFDEKGAAVGDSVILKKEFKIVIPKDTLSFVKEIPTPGKFKIAFRKDAVPFNEPLTLDAGNFKKLAASLGNWDLVQKEIDTTASFEEQVSQISFMMRVPTIWARELVRELNCEEALNSAFSLGWQSSKINISDQDVTSLLSSFEGIPDFSSRYLRGRAARKIVDKFCKEDLTEDDENISASRVYSKRDQPATLAAAVRQKRYEVVKRMAEQLIEDGKMEKIDYDNSGLSPLMIAVSLGDNIMTKLLYDYGANLDFQDENKQTALMIAAGNDDVPIARLLLEEGADPNLEDKWGTTARDIAQIEEYYDVMRLIQNYGGHKGSSWDDMSVVDEVDKVLDANTRKKVSTAASKSVQSRFFQRLGQMIKELYDEGLSKSQAVGRLVREAGISSREAYEKIADWREQHNEASRWSHSLLTDSVNKVMTQKQRDKFDEEFAGIREALEGTILTPDEAFDALVQLGFGETKATSLVNLWGKNVFEPLESSTRKIKSARTLNWAEKEAHAKQMTDDELAFSIKDCIEARDASVYAREQLRRKK